jgi:hypothetical protein
VKTSGKYVGKRRQKSTKLPTVESLSVERREKAVWQTDFPQMWINVEKSCCPPRDKKYYPVDNKMLNSEFGMRNAEFASGACLRNENCFVRVIIIKIIKTGICPSRLLDKKQS